MIFPPKNENLIKIATKTDAKWHCEWTREKENAFLWLNARVKYFDSDESGIRNQIFGYRYQAKYCFYKRLFFLFEPIFFNIFDDFATYFSFESSNYQRITYSTFLKKHNSPTSKNLTQWAGFGVPSQPIQLSDVNFHKI